MPAAYEIIQGIPSHYAGGLISHRCCGRSVVFVGAEWAQTKRRTNKSGRIMCATENGEAKMKENREKDKKTYKYPECYVPNNNPYPLCKGNTDMHETCKCCCVYQDMEEPPFDEKYGTIEEFCPFCENEVELAKVLIPQKCPVCGHLLTPCTLCHDSGYPCNYEWLAGEKETGCCRFMSVERSATENRAFPGQP